MIQAMLHGMKDRRPHSERKQGGGVHVRINVVKGPKNINVKILLSHKCLPRLGCFYSRHRDSHLLSHP